MCRAWCSAMAERCGCYREGDAIVFGEVYECTVTPKPPADLPRFIPSWRFVVPETSEGEPGIRVISCTPPPVEGVAADNLQRELDRLERPYERVLGPEELED